MLLGRETVSFSLQVIPHREQKSGWGLEAGTEAETVEKYSLWVYFPWLAGPAFLYDPDPPAQEWPLPQWTWPSQINY